VTNLGPTDTALEKLTADAQKQYAAHQDAKHDLERNTWRAAREVTKPLLDYRDDITFHRPKAIPEDQRPERAAQLTREFCAAVVERGLIVEAAGNGGGVNILDPAIDRQFFDTNQASVKARKAVKDYESDNADGLQAEIDAASAKEVTDALASGDGNRIREVLKVWYAPWRKLAPSLSSNGGQHN
jgi:hypothetical protein